MVKTAFEQCDQMARLFFNIWPFSTMKFSPVVYYFGQSRIKDISTAKRPSTPAKRFPKWQNFVQSGHTAFEAGFAKRASNPAMAHLLGHSHRHGNYPWQFLRNPISFWRKPWAGSLPARPCERCKARCSNGPGAAGSSCWPRVGWWRTRFGRPKTG